MTCRSPGKGGEAGMDLKYYTTVLVDRPGHSSARQYNGVITVTDDQLARDVKEAVGAAVCRSLGVAPDQVRVVHCSPIH